MRKGIKQPNLELALPELKKFLVVADSWGLSAEEIKALKLIIKTVKDFI